VPHSPFRLTATEALGRIAAGDLTAREWTESCLDRIEALDREIRAFVHVDPAGARKAAAEVDAGRRKGPLAGAPFAAKDIIDTHDMPTAYGSEIYAGARPAADASPVAMARAAGAVLLGKTVTTEFANLTPGPTLNPLAIDRTPGGSSSGSAAAVAAGMVPLAYGTQTTQSTIRPASYCGVHGYCPTQGDFRLSGVREAAGSFDRLGLITRSIADIALLRDVLIRRRPRTFEACPEPPSIGFCRTQLWPTMDPTLQAELLRAAARLGEAGASVVEIELPAVFAILPDAHRTVSSFEFVRNFAFEIDRHWERISPQLRHGRIADGLATTYERYVAAGAAIAQARTQLPAVFEKIDLIMTASTLGEAPHGFKSTGSAAIGALFTPLGLPCITIPAFKGPTAMPMGLQALGPLGGDDALLAQAAWIEANL